jgi:hypothetical protein
VVLGYYSICLHIDGQGLRIENARATVVNHSLSGASGAYHFEFIGPSGHILDSPNFGLLPNGDSDWYDWDPHADVAAGRYCVKLWEFGSDNPFQKDHWFQRGINTCIDVHA